MIANYKDTPREKLIEDIAKLAIRYQDYGLDKNNWYWLGMLMEEVGEVAGCLTGTHHHNIKYELRQIISICINWIFKIVTEEGEQ